LKDRVDIAGYGVGFTDRVLCEGRIGFPLRSGDGGAIPKRNTFAWLMLRIAASVKMRPRRSCSIGMTEEAHSA
jgi:hypothetical protein